MLSLIHDIGAAPGGHKKISWVDRYMPTLNAIGRTLKEEQTFKGKTVVISVHLEAKTAYLAIVRRHRNRQQSVIYAGRYSRSSR